MCGEKSSKLRLAGVESGSPPRMRGKDNRPRYPGTCPGITPACAGKRIKLRKRHSICGDHPRACGEKLGVGAARIGCGGITPAYAGKRIWNSTAL